MDIMYDYILIMCKCCGGVNVRGEFDNFELLNKSKSAVSELYEQIDFIINR